MGYSTIGGLPEAAGLDGESREKLALLVEVYERNYARNTTRMTFYRGENTVKNLGIAVPDEFATLDVSCCWAQKTVEALQSRSVFDGFTSSDEGVTKTLQGISERNSLVAKYSRAVIPELVHGCAFATVMKKPDGKSSIRFRTAEEAAALWNGENDMVDCGFVIVDSRRFQGDSSYQPSLVHYHDAGAVWELRRESSGAKWVAERKPQAMGRPLIEPLVYRPTHDKPFGQSRITRPVMSLVDSYMREMLRMEIGAELFTSPQKVLLGADPEALAGSKFSTYITNLLVVSKDEEGDVPSFLQVAASSMQPHIDVMRNLAAQFSGATSVPISELGVIHDNPSSAEAIYAAKEPLIIEADNILNAQNAISMKNIALMALAIEGNKGLSALSAAEADIVTNFKNPARASLATQTDSAVKLAAIVPEFGGTDVFWEQVGFGEDTRRKIRQQLDNNAAAQALAEVLSGAGAE